MAYNLKDWQFSHDDAPEEGGFKKPVEGDWYLLITDAVFEPETTKYTIKVRDLNNDVDFNLTYWLESQSKNDPEVRTKNIFSYKTLKSLGQALFYGEDITIPNPEDIIGGVAIGRVELKPSKSDPEKTYARVYEFFAAPQEIVESFGKRDADGNIAQYYQGAIE